MSLDTEMAEQLVKLNEENKILKKALKLACEDLSLYEDITSAEYKAKCYLQQAKESLDEKRN